MHPDARRESAGEHSLDTNDIVRFPLSSEKVEGKRHQHKVVVVITALVSVSSIECVVGATVLQMPEYTRSMAKLNYG